MPNIDNSFIYESADDKLVRAFVTTAVKIMSAVVNGDAPNIVPPINFIYQDAKSWFQRTWNGFKEAADKVVDSLRNMEGHVWDRLHNAGLTLDHLKMKWQFFWEDLCSGKFNNILRRLDSILKSIASVIDLGECLAEYKEHVELTIDHLQDLNFKDCTGLIELGLAN